MQPLEEILGREIAEIIKSQVDPWRIQVIALEKRIAEMEAFKPEKGERGEPGIDGKSVEFDTVMASLVPVVEEKIGKLFADYPKPVDGKDGAAGKDGKDADAEEIMAKVIELMPPPKDGRDGVGISSTVIDRGGNLIITKTDGAIHNAGIVVGTDGKDGAPGQTGKDGAPGRDGFGFDDLEAMDEPLRFGWRFIRGGDAKEFWWNKATLADFDHEVYREGNVYPRGAVVSSDGSLWICKVETKQRPGIGKSWRLAVKRGKDGKDGERGPIGPKGPKGENATLS